VKGLLVATLFIVGICIFALSAKQPDSKPASIVSGHKSERLDYGPVIPESSLEDPTLALAPRLKSSGGSNCLGEGDTLHPCTDEEVTHGQAEFQRQWSSFPEWLRKKCVSFTTVESMANCVVTETGEYLNTHPGEKAPWTGISPQDEQ
jgi:hypothetical protein